MPKTKPTQVDFYLTRLPDFKRELMSYVRQIILQIDPHIKEELKYGIPFYTYCGLLCYLNTSQSRDHIMLGFCYGAELLDKYHLLVGDGKFARHLLYRTKKDVNAEVIRTYIEESMVRNEMKLEMKSGRPLVLESP